MTIAAMLRVAFFLAGLVLAAEAAGEAFFVDESIAALDAPAFALFIGNVLVGAVLGITILGICSRRVVARSLVPHGSHAKPYRVLRPVSDLDHRRPFRRGPPLLIHN